MDFKWTELTVFPNPKNKFKAFLPVIVLVSLLVLLPLGIYLVKQPQVFKPKAQEMSINMGDGNQDGIIDWADLSYLYSNFFKDKPEIDLNGDGVVNSIDYALLIEIFEEKGVIKGGGGVKEGCKSDNECLDGYVCDSGSCKTRVSQTCSGPADTCPSNYVCIENCGPPVSMEGDPSPGYSCARDGTYDPVTRKRKNCPICLAANTGISTPDGEVNVGELKHGMKVYSVNARGQKIVSGIIKLAKTRAPATHKVVNLVLDDARQLKVSPNHPTVEGKTVGELKKGDRYDGSVVTLAELVSYSSGFTYDLLPDSETGFYFANGILMASTIK